jgi:enoyl-CoA hydratase
MTVCGYTLSALVSAVQLLETALAMGDKIASFSQPAVAMAKETVNASYEMTLAVSESMRHALVM